MNNDFGGICQECIRIRKKIARAETHRQLNARIQMLCNHMMVAHPSEPVTYLRNGRMVTIAEDNKAQS